MRASREVKLLSAIFLLALASWIWAETEERQQLALGGTMLVSAQSLPEAPSPAPGPEEDAPEVARDIRIARLPFLITEEPVFETPEPDAPAAPAGRPAGQVTINPFAPIVVPSDPATAPAPATQAPTTTAPTTTAPTTAPTVVDVPIRPPDPTLPGMTAPTAPGTAPSAEVTPTPALPAAPPPSVSAPASPSIGRLPRALPGGTLPISPPPLRTPRPELSASVEEAPVAAVVTDRVITQLPQQLRAAPSSLPAASNEASSEAPPAVSAEVAPLPLWRPGAETAPQPAAVNGMGQALAEQDIVFTGAVLGPVSVGIFRTNGGTAVVALGQTLPDTEIVLTDVSGQSAELTLGDQKEILTIDTGR